MGVDKGHSHTSRYFLQTFTSDSVLDMFVKIPHYEHANIPCYNLIGWMIILNIV